jgi:hypothetical protein
MAAFACPLSALFIDAELADAEAASSAGKSVASVLCGGPAKTDNKAMDF